MANDGEDRNELQSGSLEKVSGCFFLRFKFGPKIVERLQKCYCSWTSFFKKLLLII